MCLKGTTGPMFARPEIMLMYMYVCKCTIWVPISDGNADFVSVYALV